MALRASIPAVNLPFALSLLVALIVVLGVFEYRIHARQIASIPIRIHVNGTRGKSSVVRLIAAAMRE
jgi:hypothetical protein